MKDLVAMPIVRRLMWFGHVVRRDEAEVLGKTQLFEVPVLKTNWTTEVVHRPLPGLPCVTPGYLIE